MSNSNNNSQSNNNNSTQSNNQQVPYHQTEEYKQQLQNFSKLEFASYNSIKSQQKSKIKSPNINYTHDDIVKWMQNPVGNESKLVTLSNYLYNTNPIYRWTINTIAGMPKFNWKLSMDTSSKSKTKLEKQYKEAIKYLDLMRLSYNMEDVLRIGLKQDWYYGYQVESEDSYFLLKLPFEYCRPSSITDGVYNFEFNFAYFSDKEDILKSYPKEFRTKYNRAKSTKGQSMWIELDPEFSFCIKINTDIDYTLPYYANLFSSLADLNFYKELKKDSAENDNFLLLHQMIPVDEKDYNKFAIDLGLAAGFQDALNDATPERIATITSPMAINAVKMEKSKSDSDLVVQGYRDVYTDAGIPQNLSNSESSSVVGLNKAITVMEQIVFRFYRQLEQVINRKLKYKYPSAKFMFRFLDITTFNQKDKVDMYLKNAQNGIGTSLDVASASDVNAYEFINDLNLEMDILGVRDKLRPLQTSYTQSSGDNVGRPSQGDNITAGTEANQNNEVDANKLENM